MPRRVPGNVTKGVEGGQDAPRNMQAARTAGIMETDVPNGASAACAHPDMRVASRPEGAHTDFRLFPALLPGFIFIIYVYLYTPLPPKGPSNRFSYSAGGSQVPPPKTKAAA